MVSMAVMDLKVKKARNLALRHHGDQKLSDGKPYSVHLDNVYKVLFRFNIDDQDLLCASFLHDTVEDTDLKLDVIRLKFGDSVADLVYRVTDEPGSNRKERKMKTYPKIKGRAVALKLADRIANLTYNDDPKFVEMYRQEHAEFEKQCRTAEYGAMWSFIDDYFKTH